MALSGAPAVDVRPSSTLEIPPQLLAVLKGHQVDGLHFTWKRLVDDGLNVAAAGSRKFLVSDRIEACRRRFGVILGHSMGLGKTLTAIAFIMCLQADVARRCALARIVPATPSHPSFKSCGKLRVLVITAQSCIPHWEQSFGEWVRPDLFPNQFIPVHTTFGRTQPEQEQILELFYRNGGVLIMGYEEHRILIQKLAGERNGHGFALRRPRSADERKITSVLGHLRPLPDELLRPKETATFVDILRSVDIAVIDESHRVRNKQAKVSIDMERNLCDVPLRLALTGTPLQNHLEEYLCMVRVVTGIQIDYSIFKERFVVPIARGQCIDATPAEFAAMQKCVARLREFFSDKVHRCGVEILEKALLGRFETILFVQLSPKQEHSYRLMLRKMSDSNVLSLAQQAAHITAHPLLQRGVDVDCADDSTSSDEDSDTEGAIGASRGGVTEHRRLFHHGRRTAHDVELLRDVVIEDSPKLMLCVEMVKEIVTRRRQKCVVFANYLSTLRLLEHFLQVAGIGSYYLTGATDLNSRRDMIGKFRSSPPDVGPQVFLASTKAGGVGINLVPANHCILFDTSWNPTDDSQSTYRIYRYGQTLPVYIYRLCCLGTAEHVILSYALRKEWLHRKVMDIKDPERRERQKTEHFVQYPCRLPIEGWSVNHGSDKTAMETAERNSSLPFGELVAKCCPALEHLAPSLLRKVVAAVEHSFLLKDNTDEIIEDLKRSLEDRVMLANRSQAGAGGFHTRCYPEVTPAVSDTISHFERSEKPLFELCNKVVDALWNVSVEGSNEATAIDVDSESLTVLDRFEWERNTCSRLRHALPVSVCVSGAKLQVDELSDYSHRLVDFVLLGYRMACERFLRHVDHDTKAFFEGRHALSKTPRTLLETLQYTPSSLLAPVAVKELSRVMTEFRCRRSFVTQWVVDGMALLCQCMATRADTAPLVAAVGSLLSPSKRTSMEAVAAEASQRAGSDSVPPWQLLYREFVFPILEEIFPEYVDMPCSPLTEQDLILRRKGHRGFDRSSLAGVMSITEAASILGLPPGPKAGCFLCQKCNRGVVRSLPSHDGVIAQCDLCFAKLEDVILTLEELRSDVILRQWTIGLQKLEAFHVGISLVAEVAPSDCDNEAFVDRLLSTICTMRCESPAHEATSSFVPPVWQFHVLPQNLNQAGVSIVTTQIPRHPVQLLALQCGTKSVAELQHRFLRFGSGVWSHVQPNVRKLVKECLADFRSASAHQHQRLPQLFVLVALQFTASREISAIEDLLTEVDELAASRGTPTDDDELDAPDERIARLASLKCACFAVAIARYRRKLIAAPVPPSLYKRSSVGAQRKRARSESLSSELEDSQPRTQEDDEQRPSLFDVSSGSDSSDSQISYHMNDDFDDEAVIQPYTPSNDDEGLLLPSMLVVNTNTRIGAESGPSCWSDEDKQVIRKHREVLLWRSFVEVFGPRSVDVPLWLEDETGAACLLLPPDSLLDHWEGATPGSLAPMQLVDEFYSLMVELASRVPIVY